MGDKMGSDSRSARQTANPDSLVSNLFALEGFHTGTNFGVTKRYDGADTNVMPISLLVVMIISVMFHVAVVIGLAWFQMLNLHHYTYWNYLFLTFFDLFFLVTWFTSDQLFRLLNVVLFPAMFGSTFLVNILIVIILASNDWLYVSSTIFGGGTLEVGKVHLADYVVHVEPVVSRLIFLVLGQKEIVRFCLLETIYWTGGAVASYLPHNGAHASTHHRTWNSDLYSKWWYFVYWLLSPLFLMLLYSILFDPFIEYPTNYGFIESLMMVLVVDFVFQIIGYLAIHMDTFLIKTGPSSGAAQRGSSQQQTHNSAGAASHQSRGENAPPQASYLLATPINNPEHREGAYVYSVNTGKGLQYISTKFGQLRL